MGRRQATNLLIETARQVLAEFHPMTVRQVYYQLVSRQVVENNRGRYQAVSDALVAARQEGIIPWDWIEDRLRRPRTVAMWDGLPDYAEDVRRWYRRDVWDSQPANLEAWLEKDALSGIFEDVLEPYGVTLNVGRGYDGWSSIRNAARRLCEGADTTILYFGDFDPSGENMAESLVERLAFFGCRPSLVKCALTRDDIDRYHLPPNLTKSTDSRRTKFVEKFGDVSVELDALPADVLRERLSAEVESRMDLDALADVRRQEDVDRERIVELLRGVDDDG